MTGCKIESINRDRSVCTVHFSNGESRRVPRAALRAAHVHSGIQMDPENFDALLSKHLLGAAYARCAALLSAKGQTEHQLRESLQRVCYPAETVERVIASLKDAGYINDSSFAEHWISRRSSSGIGRSRIRTELRLKGVDPEVIESALAKAAEDEASTEEAEEGLQRAFEKAARNRNLNDPKEKQKVIAALVRKGYSFSDAYRALKNNP